MGEEAEIQESIIFAPPRSALWEERALLLLGLAITLLPLPTFRNAWPNGSLLALFGGIAAMLVVSAIRWRNAPYPDSGEGISTTVGWRATISRLSFFMLLASPLMTVVLLGLLSFFTDVSSATRYFRDAITGSVAIAAFLVGLVATIGARPATPERRPKLSRGTVGLKRARRIGFGIVMIGILCMLYRYPFVPDSDGHMSGGGFSLYAFLCLSLLCAGEEFLRNIAIIYQIPPPTEPERPIDDWRDIMPIALLVLIGTGAVAFLPELRLPVLLMGGAVLASQGAAMIALHKRARAERMALG